MPNKDKRELIIFEGEKEIRHLWHNLENVKQKQKKLIGQERQLSFNSFNEKEDGL